MGQSSQFLPLFSAILNAFPLQWQPYLKNSVGRICPVLHLPAAFLLSSLLQLNSHIKFMFQHFLVSSVLLNYFSQPISRWFEKHFKAMHAALAPGFVSCNELKLSQPVIQVSEPPEADP